MKKRYFIIHVAIENLEHPEKCVMRVEEVAWLKKKSATMKALCLKENEAVQCYFYARHWYDNSYFPFIYISREILRKRLRALLIIPFSKKI